MGAILPRLHSEGSAARDALALKLDELLLGAHWHTEWIARMPWTWLSATMSGAYASYYVLLIGLPLWFWLTRQRYGLSDVAFRLLLVYAACALCYLIFPVIGPAAYPPKFADSLGTSLPSTHAAGSMSLALAAWRWLPRPIGFTVIAMAVAIAFSTVYTQN